MLKENSKAIYLQIADKICDDVLEGTLWVDHKLPSVREYAAMVQVNPNTMMRTYEYLSSLGILYNKRGIGFFLSYDAPEIVRDLRIKELVEGELVDVFRRLALLGMDPELLKKKYEEYINETVKRLVREKIERYNQNKEKEKEQ